GAPDLLANLGACNHHATLLDEQREHLERLRRQRDALAVTKKLGGVRIQLERSKAQHSHGSWAYSANTHGSLSGTPISGKTGKPHHTCGLSTRLVRSGRSTLTPQEMAMRLNTGTLAPGFAAESIGGRRVSLEQLRGRPVLLKFYRFATCPVCNLHMHRFIQDHRMVRDAGLTTVVLYHSPADKLVEAQDYPTPSDLVPDAGKKIFRAYGVERGLRGFVSPTVMREYFKALVAGYSPGLFSSDGGVTGDR